MPPHARSTPDGSAASVELARILARERPALARAVTLLENERAGAAELAASLVAHCGRAHVLGITGAPGSGKSTLINALLGELTRRGRQVAVVAVDPSSPVSGGALLGDRVRMGEHGAGDNVFIRSLSARGHLGGVARATGRVVDLFDAAGFDVVIVETVGVGQSEVDIGRVADTRIVVCAPGLGDEVQAIKAGVLEIADILAVSKGDQPDARRTLRDVRTAAQARHASGREPDVVLTVATAGQGVAELVDLAEAHAREFGVGRRAREAAPRAVAAAAPHATDDALFEALAGWRARGKGVALATVVRTWGSSPRPQGSLLAVAEDGAFLGSVSGGCIEGAVIGEALEAIRDGQPRMLEYGVSDAQAWEVGLACGGRVQVFVERVE
ncbi:MAG: methylmalonyl Co-A mutase-associated GTPase MeaB [Rhodocyclales bacterium]|nr:methylmalonyl Co-A mutase-associated GTPase MeaB [Rhodocyclales bacterium]